MRRLVVPISIFAALVILYLCFWPSPMDPETWSAPSFDAERWKPTGTLAEAERIELPDGHGPEDVEVDGKGRIYTGLQDGRILRFDDRSPITLADTKGRPLGLHWAQDGRLLVADASIGLLAIDERGAIEVLTSTCADTRLVFTDHLDVAADGTIWFSDASSKFGLPEWKLDIVENRPNGRLCAYDPKTKTTREILRELYFANGVAIDPEQEFVLLNETSRYRIKKLWIAGPKAGTSEIIIDNLPGFPDNLSTGTNGIFWIAIASPRDPIIDGLSGSPFLRKMIMRLPAFLQPAPARTARVIGVDENGKVVHDLFDPEGRRVYVVTGVQERDGWLYLGSLFDRALARAKVPPPRSQGL